MKKIVVILISLIWACSEMYVVPEDHYLISEGRHEAKLVNGSGLDKIRTLKSNRLMFTARFDNSARYDLKSKDQYDLNKLMGFSLANSHHHENSARLGWCYSIDKDAVEIFSYVYRHGDLSYQHIADVGINQTVQYQINLFANEIEFVVGGRSLRVERSYNDDTGLYYLLYPYFGGDSTAPHDIHIYITEVF